MRLSFAPIPGLFYHVGEPAAREEAARASVPVDGICLRHAEEFLGHARQSANRQRAVDDNKRIVGAWRDVGWRLQHEPHATARANARGGFGVALGGRPAAMAAEELLRPARRLFTGDVER